MTLRRRLNSLTYAIKGFSRLMRTQPNAKIHLLAGTLAAISGFYFSISLTEWCLVVFAITTVFGAEAFNTAIEEIIDFVSPDFHPMAGAIKDMAAAGVLFVSAGAAAVGLIIFLPKIFPLFSVYL